MGDRYLQAAAALVTYPVSGISRQLLRLLCWAPAKRFGLRTVQGGTLAWNWVASASSKEARVALLSEVVECWLATRTARLGLFSPKGAPVAEVGAGMDAPPPAQGRHAHELLDAILAHHLWVGFFTEASVNRCRGAVSAAAAAAAPCAALPPTSSLPPHQRSPGTWCATTSPASAPRSWRPFGGSPPSRSSSPSCLPPTLPRAGRASGATLTALAQLLICGD